MAAAIPVIQVAAAMYAVTNVLKAVQKGDIKGAILNGVSAYFAFSGLGASTLVQNAAGQGAGGVVTGGTAAIGEAGGELAAETVAGTLEGAASGTSAAMTEGMGAAAEGIGAAAEGVSSTVGTVGTSGGAGAGVGAAAGTVAQPGIVSGGEMVQGGMDVAMGGAAGAGLEGAGTAAVDSAMTQAGGGGGFLSSLKNYAGESLSTLKEGSSAVTGFLKDNPELVKTGGEMLGGWAQAKAEEAQLEKLLKLKEEERARRGAAVGGNVSRLYNF